MLKKATVGISREIWCSNPETGRFDEKLGDSRENRAGMGLGVRVVVRALAPTNSVKLLDLECNVKC